MMPRPCTRSGLALCLLIVLIVVVSSALASELGEPLSVEDWEVLDPTLSISLWSPRVTGCSAGFDRFEPLACDFGIAGDGDGAATAVDAVGNTWRWRKDRTTDTGGNPLSCNGYHRFDIEIIRCDDAQQCSVVARLSDRCSNGAGGDKRDAAIAKGFWLDVTNGALFLNYESWAPPAGNDYVKGHEVIRIGNLPTLFAVRQSFVPSMSQFGFRVPYMSEGFPAADWFDTYYGDIATVGDWSQAQPLECEYPASMPDVGDYLTVDDPLPNPSPGQGRFYVTAVSYQGQTRYGRKAIGGVLSGRDPAALQTCEDTR